jgi:hypothetical protein
LGAVLGSLVAGLAEAEPCPLAARLSGDARLVEALREQLEPRGVKIAGEDSCARVEARVEPVSEGIELRLLGPGGEEEVRTLRNLSTAAALIETWSRLDSDDPLGLGLSPMPRLLGLSPRLVEVPGAPVRRPSWGSLSLGLGFAGPSPEGRGVAVRAGFCANVGAWCVGGAFLWQETSDGSCGDDCVTSVAQAPPPSPLEVKTQHRDTSFQLGAERLVPVRGVLARLGGGLGLGTHRPQNESFVFGLNQGERSAVLVGGARVSVETPLVGGLGLEVSLSTRFDALALSRGELRYPDAEQVDALAEAGGSLFFANGPTLSGQFSVGLRYGVP